MGMFDKMRKKATKAVDQHGDKIGQGIDRAADAARKRTGGKHDDKIAKGASAAKNALDNLDGRDDDIRDTPRGTPRDPGPGGATPPR